MRKEHAPPFFAPISGPARNGKQFECGHTRNFCRAEGPAKMLVGELPKPAGLRDKVSQSPGAMRLLSAACRYRSWALFSRPSVTPSRWSIFALTATASRISAWAWRYSA